MSSVRCASFRQCRYILQLRLFSAGRLHAPVQVHHLQQPDRNAARVLEHHDVCGNPVGCHHAGDTQMLTLPIDHDVPLSEVPLAPCLAVRCYLACALLPRACTLCNHISVTAALPAVWQVDLQQHPVRHSARQLEQPQQPAQPVRGNGAPAPMMMMRPQITVLGCVAAVTRSGGVWIISYCFTGSVGLLCVTEATLRHHHAAASWMVAMQ